MEILLTHDQQGDAIDTALARCTRDRELSPVHTVAEEVCRTQLAKVVEWAKAHDCCARLFEPNKDGECCGNTAYVDMDKGDLWLDLSDWQALREAAGEGR